MKLAMTIAFAATAALAAVQEPAPSRAWVTNYVAEAVDRSLGTNVERRIAELDEQIEKKLKQLNIRLVNGGIQTNKVLSIGGVDMTASIRLLPCTRNAIVGTYSTIPSITNMVYWAWSDEQQAFVNYKCGEIPVLRPAMATNVVTRPVTNRLFVAIDPNAMTNQTAKYEQQYFISYETSTNVTPYLYAPRNGDQYGWITAHGEKGGWSLVANSTNAADSALHIQLRKAKITERTYAEITARPRLLMSARLLSANGDGGHWDYDDCIPQQDLRDAAKEFALDGWLTPLDSSPLQINDLPFLNPPNFDDTYKDEHGDSHYPTRECAEDIHSYLDIKETEGIEYVTITYGDEEGGEYTEEIPLDLFLEWLDPPWEDLVQIIDEIWVDPTWVEDDKKPPVRRHKHKWKTCRCECGATREHSFAYVGKCSVCINFDDEEFGGGFCGFSEPGEGNHGGWHGCGMADSLSNMMVFYPAGKHCCCSCGEYSHVPNAVVDERHQHIAIEHPWEGEPSSYDYEVAREGGQGDFCLWHTMCSRDLCDGEKVERKGHTWDDKDFEYDPIDEYEHWKIKHCKKCGFGNDQKHWDLTREREGHTEDAATLQITAIDEREHALSAYCKYCGEQMLVSVSGEYPREAHMFGSNSPQAKDGWVYYNPTIEGEGDEKKGYHDRFQTCIGNGILPEKGGCGALTNETHLACERETDPICHCAKCEQELPHEETENECGFIVCELCGKFLETSPERIAAWNNPPQHSWYGGYDSTFHYCKCGKFKGVHYEDVDDEPYRQDDDYYYYRVRCQDRCGYLYPDKKVPKDGKSGTDEDNKKECTKNSGYSKCKHGGSYRAGHDVAYWSTCYEHPDKEERKRIDEIMSKECNCPDMPEGGVCPVCGETVSPISKDDPPYRDEEVSRELKVVMLDVPPPIQTWQITIRRTWKDGKVEIIHKVENVWPL